jgi:hypothetical protein
MISLSDFNIGGRALARALSYALSRGFRHPFVPLQCASTKQETLCEGAEIEAITPFVWDTHIPRIRGAASYGAEQVIREDLHRKTFELRPVVAHWLRDAALLDGSVYSGGYRHELRPVGNKPRIGLRPSPPMGEMGVAALVSTCAGSTWWGHWMEDEAPLQMLAETLAPVVAHNRPAYRDEAAYRELFGISEPPRYGVAYFRELIIIDEFAQNPDKTRRYHLLRKRLSALPRGHERIFLNRGKTGSKRVLVNEESIRARLEREGFVTVDVAQSSVQDIVSACRGATVVVSVEGSHLAPLLYLLQDHGVMVILNPPYQVHTTVADIGVFCGLSSGMFVCEPAGDSKDEFSADPDELMRFVDHALRYGVTNRPKLQHFLERVSSMNSAASFF